MTTLIDKVIVSEDEECSRADHVDNEGTSDAAELGSIYLDRFHSVNVIFLLKFS